jgi:hypothetical protein
MYIPDILLSEPVVTNFIERGGNVSQIIVKMPGITSRISMLHLEKAR